MMKKLLFLFTFLIAQVFLGCSKSQNDPLFSNTVSNQPGTLVIVNNDSYIGSVPMGNILEFKLTLRANGGLDLFNIAASLSSDTTFTYKGGSYPGIGGNCGASLISGSTCDIIINYTPVAVMTNYLTISFTYADNTTSKSLSKTFEADSHPILTFQYGTRYDFGNKFVGSSTDLTVTITNTGKAAATNLSIGNLTLPYSFKGGSYPGTGGSCGASVQVGTTCDIVINYSPSTSGQNLQDITLNYKNVGNAEQSILNLTAYGLFPAVISLSDAGTFNFGTTVASADHDKTYTLTYVSGDVSGTGIGITGLTTPFAYKGGTFPGTGGTCSTSLRSGSCTIVLTMNTASSGTWQNTFSVQYHDGKTLQIFSRTIRGITKQKPIITVSPSTTFDFGTIHTGLSSTTKTYTFTYVSGELPALNVAADNLTAPFSYAGGSYPGTGGTCNGSLSSGSCTVVLVYSPVTQNSLWQDAINLSYDDYITRIKQAVTLSGSTESKMSFSAATVPFGNTVTNTTATASAILTFTGGIPATTITPITTPGVPFAYSGAGTFPGLSGSCVQGGTASATCTIEFIFTPTGIGANAQTYSLTYYDGFATKTLSIDLTGTGVGPAVITIPNSDFGSTSTNSQVHKTITITNSTSMDATTMTVQALPAGYVYKNGTYPGVGGTCNTTLAAGTSCNIVLTYNPTNAGTNNGNLTIAYNNGQANTSSSGGLTGTAINTNDLFISDYDAYDFGANFFTTSKEKTFTLSHGGGSNTATTITGAGLSADYSYAGGTFPGTGGTCGNSLTSGSSCTFVVRFSPTSSGARNNNITINYNNGTTNASVTRLTTGVGIQQPVITITPAPYDFGLQPIGATYEKVFNVTVTMGTYTPLYWSGDILGSGFNYKGGAYPGTGGTCTSSYFSNTCTIVVVFTPTSTASYSGTARIIYYNYIGTEYATADLTGSGKGSALLSFSQSPTYDFGKVVQTASSEATLTLNNTGTLNATSVSAATLNAPYSFKGGTYPGTGGTCGTTLAPGSCTIVTKFTPTSTGVSNSTVTINYNNGTSATQSSISLTGQGVAQAVLSISDGSPYNYGSVVVGSALDKTFTVTNGGETQSTTMGGTFNGTQFKFKGGSYPGTGGSCGSTLNAASTCTIVLSFAPSSLGISSDIFKLNYKDGLGTQTEFKNISGTAVAAFKPATLLSMIPIQKITVTTLPTFTQNALSINGDNINLNDGSTISGTQNLIIKKGNLIQYFNLLDDNIDFSTWGLSKLSLGDINNDGVDDFIISHFNPNATPDTNDEIFFTCYSGKDLSVIYSISIPNPSHYFLGLSSKNIPQDVDGDGHNDFITGLYLHVGDQLVLKDFIIFSSRTGLPIP